MKEKKQSLRQKMTDEELLKLSKQISKNTLIETLDIKFVEIGDDFIVASMPVTPKVHQPDGVLHGGASVALAETIGSTAAFIFHEDEDYFIRGIEISANHVKSIRSGTVVARTKFLHKGRTTQLQDIYITDEDANLISVVRLTTIALPKRD